MNNTTNTGFENSFTDISLPEKPLTAQRQASILACAIKKAGLADMAPTAQTAETLAGTQPRHVAKNPFRLLAARRC